MMLLQLVFVWKVMPETKGVSLEELEHRLGIAPECDVPGQHNP
jgi:hypothetical protein